ncbi:hypothetical protein OESDEN_10052 [Oesophagostomum dentatum]|uniref:Uncharacterized protein n=1 Tax=Oesophagostomum dentatum TaxID=61180 RepID=A0A0B1T416_OESDE|nr:hypothetical protein OESDEN_10052 [Oesophagostomum dentatum]
MKVVTTTDDWWSQFTAFLLTTASVYIVEMGLFLIGLVFYHFCIFMPRVRRKLYKEPTTEASKSLMRISGMLPVIGEVDKTQIDEDDEDRDDLTQKEVDGIDPLLAEVHKKRKKLHLDVHQEASTPPSSLRDDDTTPTALTPSTFVPPKKSLHTSKRKSERLEE